MTQEDSSTASPIEDTQEYPCDKTRETMNATPFFPVTGKVTFKPMMATPERGAWPLSPGMARLVSLVSLSAVVLWPLSGCGSLADSNLPCPVPTAESTGTPVPDGTPTASCTTGHGTHYVWIHSRGGWVESDDGVHPKSNTQGVGVDEGHSGTGEGHGGVGEGHGGSGHGGGDGG